MKFQRLFAAGLLGVISLIPEVTASTRRILRDTPELQNFPLAVAVVLNLIQPVGLLAFAVWLGLRCAPRVGITSLIADGSLRALWRHGRNFAPTGLVVGSAIALAQLGLDTLLKPYLGASWQAYTASARIDATGFLSGILYGGVTEELLVRWGPMSAVAWAVLRVNPTSLLGRKFAVWISIGVTALLFGVAHLPAVSGVATLTMPLALRTIALNALSGIVYGWLCWNRGLESAMITHASTNVSAAIISQVVSLLARNR